jgi:hypothetical protein
MSALRSIADGPLVRKKYVDEILSIKPECQVQWFQAPHMLLETHPDAAADAINQFCLRLC